MSIVPEWKMTVEESIRRRGSDGHPVDINSVIIDTGLPYEVVNGCLEGIHGQKGRYRGSDQYCGQKKLELF